MTPFTRFRAWQLILGAVALSLLPLPLFVRGQRLDPAYLLVVYPLILGWAWLLGRRAGVDPRRLAGP
ncbi:MAG TPA: hypothetical protein VNH46_13430, partial [Gemmatimonadales bacterium]|nr:hypothetical protein [Gemmatimonadales bacterium]